MNVLQASCRPGPVAPLPPDQQKVLASAARDMAAWDRVYPASAVSFEGCWILAGRWGDLRGVAVGHSTLKVPAWTHNIPLPPDHSPARSERDTTHRIPGTAVRILRCDAGTLASLRRALPWFQPRVSGDKPSFGFGDRLGVAAPGHLAALGKSNVFPVLAQQSIREMTRTRRTPAEVMDAAVFGAIQCGWISGFGADADHLKTDEDVDRMADAGFVFFTLDPSAHVDDAVRGDSDAALEAKYCKVLESVEGAKAWESRYLGKAFAFEGRGGAFEVTLDARALREAAVKYGRAVAHAAALAARVKSRMAGRAFEIEVSVDETALPTTPGEHLFIARELRERGASIKSLAPRFIGDFEKGIDYKGDLAEFERAIERHAAIARAHGGYKISVHSGSDKFSAYPAVARATAGRFHVKTAGTSYLEALRVAARKAPDLFREIADFCRGRYDPDKATYHVSARLDAVPAPAGLSDRDLEHVYLDADDGRQILHVTFGSVLTAEAGSPVREPVTGDPESGTLDPGADRPRWRFRSRLLDLLVKEEAAYTEVLAQHLGKHMKLLA